MSQDYYIILTNLGNAKVADAIAGGDPIALTQMAVGSAVYTPSPGQTALVTEEWRAALNSLYRDPDNLNHVVAEAVVPTDVGGWEVNEVGVFDSDGDLFAIGKYPPTYKPALASGSGKDLYIRFIMEVSNDAAVTLNIDPAIVLATRNHVAQSITAHDAAADAHVKDFVMPFAGLNYPVIDTADNEIGATGAAATNGGTVSVPADVMLAIGEEVTAKTGRNRMFTTTAYTTDDLDLDTSYYLRCQVDAEGALEIYVQKGTDDDAVPAGLKGTPNGATGGGFPTTVLDMLLAKITTGAAASVPTVTDIPNARELVLATKNYVAESITEHDELADAHNGSLVFPGFETFISAPDPPYGWHEQDNAAYSMTTYEALFDFIGVMYGKDAGIVFTADYTTNTLTSAGHGRSNDDIITQSNSGGALPAGLSANTKCFIVNATTDTYQVSATKGGTPIDFTDNGTGIHSFHTQFRVPDMRGEFPRGWDHGAGNDPDAATRTDRGDGTGGDVVGSKQADELASHRHEFDRYDNIVLGSSAAAKGGAGEYFTDYTGGNETRPRNINKMFIIKY